MSRQSRCRHVPKPLPCRRTAPFDTTETAWFWLHRARLVRAQGARLDADPLAAARPCDPDDIVRVARRLVQSGALHPDHVRVLDRHGRRLTPPDDRLEEEAADARLWREALDRLAPPLRAKGIVA